MMTFIIRMQIPLALNFKKMCICISETSTEKMRHLKCLQYTLRFEKMKSYVMAMGARTVT